jgi:hypothetical protein
MLACGSQGHAYVLKRLFALPNSANKSLVDRRFNKAKHFSIQALNLAWYRVGTVMFFNAILRAFHLKFKVKNALSKNIFCLLILLRKGFLY